MGRGEGGWVSECVKRVSEVEVIRSEECDSSVKKTKSVTKHP